MSSPAPALDRGIAVMQALQKENPLTLEQLSQLVDSPKSSLLRILSTLQQHGWVKRNSQKQYVPMLHLTPLEQTQDWETYLVERLSDLGRMLNLTVEWYQRKEEKAVITWRYEPENSPVHIRARVGFIRNSTGELDAVAQVLLKSTELKPGKDSWTYLQGEKAPLSTAEVRKKLNAISGRIVGDTEYNPNGVRRLAVSILNLDGTLRGIISIAESYTPKTDSLRIERMESLQGAADDLETFLHKECL